MKRHGKFLLTALHLKTIILVTDDDPDYDFVQGFQIFFSFLVFHAWE